MSTLQMLRLQRGSASIATRSAITAAIVALAFAAPSLLALSHGLTPASESRLGRAVLSSFGGITLPILGAAVVAAFFGAGTQARTRADRLVAAGLEPRAVVSSPLLFALAAAIVPAGLVGALTVAAMRMTLHLGGGGLVAFDALTTAWSLMLGAATWTALAALFVVRSGRPGRGYLVVLIDLAFRLLPGAIAWISPSAHVANLLGAPPPRGLVRVPVLSQPLSVVVLVALTATILFVVTRRYQGAPSR